MTEPNTVTAEAATPTTAAATKPVVKMKVTIKRAPNTGAITITMPTTNALISVANPVIPHLDIKYRPSAMPYAAYSLRDAVYYTYGVIPIKEWARAISTFLVCAKDYVRETEASYEAEAVLKGGYLAVGDTLYKLDAVEMRSLNAARHAISRRLTDKAKVEATQLMDDTKRAAGALLASMDKERLKLDTDREAFMKEKKTIIPAWVTENFILCSTTGRADYPLGVCFLLNFKPKQASWQFTDPTTKRTAYNRWKMVTDAPSISTLITVPINPTTGDYSERGIHVSVGFPVLPHVNRSGSCMSIGDSPKTIKTLNDFYKLRDSFSRVMNEDVALWSLFTNPNEWAANIVYMFDPFLRAVFTKAELGSSNWSTYLTSPSKYKDELLGKKSTVSVQTDVTPEPPTNGSETWAA